MPQLAARQNWSLLADYFAIGIALFAFGLFKKTVLIDPFVPYLDLVLPARIHSDTIGDMREQDKFTFGTISARPGFGEL